MLRRGLFFLSLVVFAGHAIQSHAATVTITPKPTGGTVTSNVGGINCGTGGSACTSTSIAAAVSVTLTATPASVNYTFDSWNVTGLGTSTANPLTFPMQATNVSGSATFIYHATVNGVCGSDAGGTFVNAPSNLCNPGSPSGVTGSNTTWDWTCIGSYGGTSPGCSAQRQYLVTYTAAAGGTVSGSASQQLSYSANATTVTAVPSTNYVFTNWTEGASVVSTSPSLNVSGVTANHDYVAHFAAANLFISPTPTGGTVTSSVGGINCGDSGNSCLASIAVGSQVTLTATPSSSNYTFTSWTLGTNTTTVNPLVVASMPTGAVTGSASFAYHASVNGVCGSSANDSFPFPPTDNLCVTGAPTAVTAGASTWGWTCTGFWGGSDASCSAARIPVVTRTGANMATLALYNGSNGTGYFTLLAGGSDACGSASQTKAGRDIMDSPALQFGSLPLSAGTSGSYTLRNLSESSAYTICFATENGASLLAAPSTALTTTASLALTSPQWHAIGDTSSTSAGATLPRPSLAFAPDGAPYVAYVDNGKLTVLRLDVISGAWTLVGDTGLTPGQVYGLSLAFAPDGTPYLGYTDGATTVIAYSGGTWSTVGSPTFSLTAATSVSLAFAPNGTPYLAFSDPAVSVKAFIGGTWSYVGSAAFSLQQNANLQWTGDADYLSLAFAPDGTPYVAYQDRITIWNDPNNPDFYKATVMQFTNGAWSTVGSRGFSAGNVAFTSLAFGPNGTPYLAFQDASVSAKATVMAFSGGTWSAVGSAGFTSGEADYLSLAFTPAGSPALAYMDVANGSKASVMKYSGGAWSSVGSGGFSSGQGSQTSLAFAPDGTSYVAYEEDALGQIRIARYSDVTTISSLNRLTPLAAQTNAASVTYRATYAAPVTGVLKTDFDLSPTLPGAAVTGVAPVGTPPATQWDITVATGAGIGPLTLRQTSDYGMAPGVSGLPFTGQSYAIDLVPPTVRIGAPAVSIFSGNAVDYAVSYSDPNFGSSTLSAGNVILNSTGTASGSVTVHGSGASRVVTIGNLSGSGTLGISVSAGTATDVFGNSSPAAGPSASFAVPLPPQQPLATPSVIDTGAGMATLVLPESVAMTRYFTLLAGNNAACGSGSHIVDGLDSFGNPALRFGSLPLSSDPAGHYTLRNLSESTGYTVCYTATTATSMLQVPASISFSTTASTAATLPLWYSVGNPGFSSGQASYTSLGFAPDGTPYVAYEDGANGNKATVMGYSGGIWSALGGAGFSAGSATSLSFTFAPDGTPYLAYQDGVNGNKATVMKYNGFWSVEGNPAFSAGQANNLSLAFAPDGTPHVAYQDTANGNKATVMRYSGGNWSPVGSAGFSAGQASPSLAFAPDGTPYVAYRDGANGNKATVMKYGGGAWSPVGSVGFSADQADFVSIAFAPDGTLYAAYQDNANGSKMTVMSYGSGIWSAVGSTGFSSGVPEFLSLAFAPDGTPYVAYRNSGTGYIATAMKYSGGAWSVVGNASFSAGWGSLVSIAFAPNGAPYVAYSDGANGSKATVMWFSDPLTTAATAAASSITTTGATLNGMVNSYGVTDAVSFEYGTTTAYGSSVSAGSLAVTVDTPVSAAITGLSCGTNYHYRIKAVNSSTVYGNDLSFNTPSCLLQTITFSPLASIAVGSADLDPGAVASSGLPVSYSSSNTSVATIVNGKIHAVAAGPTTITASQAGNGIYGPAQNVSQPLTVQSTTVALTLTFSGAGGGSVNGAMACTTGSACNPAAIAYGTPVSLTATADSGSLFTAWSGDCSGGNPCQLTMDRDRSANAAFSAADRARIGSTGYGSLALAYAAASALAPTTIKLLDIDLKESFTQSVRDIVLWGGWDKTFASDAGLSTVLHGLTVTGGSLRIRSGVVVH